MAHECPDCGLICYCNGDIDDCVFSYTPEQDFCQHCICEGCGETDSECCCDPDYEWEDEL